MPKRDRKASSTRRRKRKYRLWVVWGSRDTIRDNQTGCQQEYEFNTRRELAAFLQGVAEGSGWDDCTTFPTEADADQYVADCLVEVEQGS
jgi:hypothetical protein